MANRNKKCNNDGKNQKSYRGRNPRARKTTKSKDREALALQDQEAAKDYNNNPSWYYADKFLADQVSTFSLNQFLQEDGKPFTGSFEKVEVPPIMTLYFNPSPGYSRGESVMDGGLNKACIAMYTKLSSMNAKTTQYAPQDIGMLLLALGEVISISEHIRRFFRVVFTYNKRNWAYPKGLVEAMGFEFVDDVKLLANLRMRFNSILNGINKISFPGDIAYFSKCAEMYSHVYVDSESPMAQTYVFVPASTWLIDETSFEGGEILKTVDVAGQSGTPVKHPVDWYLDLLERMIREITTTSVFNYIYADVMRLVDPGRLLTMPYLTEGEAIAPEYDPMILLQIDNLNIINAPTGSAVSETHTSGNDVYQKVDNNAIFYAPLMFVGSGSPNRLIINFPHSMGNPDADQRIEATRMLGMYEGTDEETERASLPDHYCVGITFSSSVDGLATNILRVGRLTKNTLVAPTVVPLTWTLEKFSHHPRIYILDNEDVDKVVGVVGDLDFFTDIDIDYLIAVNDLAFNQLFTVAV